MPAPKDPEARKLWRKRLSESHSGQVPWNKGKVGVQAAWNKGTKGVMKANKTSFKKNDPRLCGDANPGRKNPERMINLWKDEEFRRKQIESRRETVPSGENHYKWKGGITPENEKIRQSHEMRVWREFVFERDDYQCQECLKWSGELRAHHCKSFSEYPHLRFQTWNGITLCKECHQQHHRGRRR